MEEEGMLEVKETAAGQSWWVTIIAEIMLQLACSNRTRCLFLLGTEDPSVKVIFVKGGRDGGDVAVKTSEASCFYWNIIPSCGIFAVDWSSNGGVVGEKEDKTPTEGSESHGVCGNCGSKISMMRRNGIEGEGHKKKT
ncbi:13628_t:CDS:2 [Ambispora gerdemannii]|uniref:13628_t:CDS:1 n=1 Tax=Ambispora gerdemannii TaxID=144530 RepID=A0A9N8VK61_9GLOM|nr:13628_t:CDS:2 [Ambispora gerdemannii]